MSHTSVRWRAAAAQRRLVDGTRRLRAKARRGPRSSPLVPRPPRLARGAHALRITHALLGCDLNPLYLDFWPLARRAWREVAGIEPLLVLVAEPDEVPSELAADPGVHVFPPVPGVHTAFQAQCIRLLYPGLLDVDGGVVISDADMVPLSPRYFHRPAGQIDESHFLAYRDVHTDVGEVTICYNAALPRTWRAVFGVATLDEARARLSAWGGDVPYTGERGGPGWVSDQRLLYETLVEHGCRTRTVWILDDHSTGYRRFERSSLRRPELRESDRRLILRGAYSDFHCAMPYGDFRELNDLVVDLAAEAARR